MRSCSSTTRARFHGRLPAVLLATALALAARAARAQTREPGTPAPGNKPLTVTVLGEVLKPGTYTVQAGDTLIQAIAIAGGLTPDADQRRAALRRAGKEIPADLHALFWVSDPGADVPLQDGDVLFVPSGLRVFLFGAFRKPGVVTVPQEATVVDVVLAGGGLAPGADPGSAAIVRVADGKVVQTPFDLKAALTGGAASPPFKQSDILCVPRSGSPPLRRILQMAPFGKPLPQGDWPPRQPFLGR